MLYKSILLISLFTFQFGFYSVKPNQDPNQEIIGTWISADDPTQKWVFNDSKNSCVWYTNNESTESFNYSISYSSPQCGLPVDVNNETIYLKLIDRKDGGEYCYEINGVNYDNSGILSITFLGTNKLFLFKKEPESSLD